jgi:hypothetical protein
MSDSVLPPAGGSHPGMVAYVGATAYPSARRACPAGRIGATAGRPAAGPPPGPPWLRTAGLAPRVHTVRPGYLLSRSAAQKRGERAGTLLVTGGGRGLGQVIAGKPPGPVTGWCPSPGPSTRRRPPPRRSARLA